ncbi:MAG: hypothetical protein ABL916_16695 [Burkholderiaceae bacterium]
MHQAQAVAAGVLATRGAQAANTVALTSGEASKFANALVQDARDEIYSAAFSVCEAVQGLDRQMFTWSTVKLYYSVFYLARASLGLSRVGLIYVKQTPYTWVATPGGTPKKSSGTTHKAALAAFALHRASSPLLSQLIGVTDPFEWLVSLREAANYRLPKFSEPDAPDHFKFVARFGVRRLLSEYLADDAHHYTFDPDHAMLAFPVATLRETMAQLRTVTGAGLSQSDCSVIGGQCFDRQGPIAEMRKLLSRP